MIVHLLRTLVTVGLVTTSLVALAQSEPPQAARKPQDVTVHGDKRIDDYFWLRERDNPAVIAHLTAEAAYTAEWLKPLAGLKEQLYKEMLGRIQQADEAVPVRRSSSAATTATTRRMWSSRPRRLPAWPATCDSASAQTGGCARFIRHSPSAE